MEIKNFQIPEMKNTRDKTFKFIGISHKTASVSQREQFHVSEKEKEDLVKLICKYFSDVTGLLILATCNRTEIYFESTNTSTTEILNAFIDFKGCPKSTQDVFISSNKTKPTIKHLLHVSSGLESMVVGDAEIIHQIKKAYQYAMQYKLQGSVLERTLQTVFKAHKRISNETNFRDGTTSVAYKSLKTIKDTYNMESLKSKKILFIGAGNIVKQLFKYNNKFKFTNIYISNRSNEKALLLANKNNCKTYAWDNIVSNNFNGFDIIISAVSNSRHLIKEVANPTKKLLLIDLAVPCNMDQTKIQSQNIIYHDIDTISSELEKNKNNRLAAIDTINIIINEEILAFEQWLQKAPLRNLLIELKTEVKHKIKAYLYNHSKAAHNTKVETLTNLVMKKLIHSKTQYGSFNIDTIISNHIAL
ncbi:glutamyl-tRNA reductase [Aestuariivivens insulae]|uniref:glutamyl-tRNA reductase n=1 Tax=Aestuariivivens insulae TaxID=1621988 RepID=UPI001F586D7F|nr:glutamyl-tRNA reductase [Aestuariivivens insulae]